MKLIIQIPCYNEAKTLPIALAELPRKVKGFDKVEWQIIDDGSSDETCAVARAHGVDHVVQLNGHQGLAKGFMTGLLHAVNQGADVVVNTDADNQYNAADIPKLVQPILENRADIVIGARPIQAIEHFSGIKKFLQRLGSWVVRKVSGADVADAPSGFRAIRREAAMQLNVFNRYTYTLETIIQAGLKNLRLLSVPIRVNKDLRPSRLVKSIASYIQRSIFVIFRVLFIYKPFLTFISVGSVFFLAGFGLGVRWLILFGLGTTRTHVPSLILASVFLMTGILFIVAGILADLISVNRQVLEENRYRLRLIEAEMRQDRHRPGRGA